MAQPNRDNNTAIINANNGNHINIRCILATILTTESSTPMVYINNNNNERINTNRNNNNNGNDATNQQ